MSSDFPEQLTVNLPPNHWRLDIPWTSMYSQSLTIAPSSRSSFGQKNSKYSSGSKPMPPLEDVESGTSPKRREMLNPLFSDPWMLNGGVPEPPGQDPRLTQCPPLRIEKRRLEKRRRPRQSYNFDLRKQQRRLWYIVIVTVIVLALLIGDVIFLNIRVLLPSTTSQTTLTANGLSADAQQCLSQYTLDAPSSPQSYPCSTCPSVLLAVPSAFMTSSAHTQTTQVINSAVQFCSLRAIYETANTQGQATLRNGSWAQDVNFCTWTGVNCDTSGQIASLQLTYPGVPATLPDEIGGLTTLQTLEIIGGNATPAGSLPGSFTNLTSLMTLHLEATSITALPNSLFVSPGLTRLSTIALIRNPQMGTSLPSSLTSLTGLQNLLVNSQALSPSALTILASSSSLAVSLHTLDLTSTSLTGSIPRALSSFNGLGQLLLGYNNLTGTVPTFPSTLQVLELDENAGLNGSITCTSGSLKQCSVQGTAISVAGCEVCQNATTNTAR